jgi:CheY-like chemotaxis protein
MNTAKILLAEDDRFLRYIYTEALNEKGYSLELAINGEDAYEKIQQGNWDLVLLDVIMPKMTGIEVLNKIRKTSQKVFAKKIVFLTNVSDAKELHEINALGNEYLIKSELSPQELIQKIEGYLNK